MSHPFFYLSKSLSGDGKSLSWAVTQLKSNLVFIVIAKNIFRLLFLQHHFFWYLQSALNYLLPPQLLPNCTLRTLYTIFNENKVQCCYQWPHQFVWPISTLQKLWENPTLRHDMTQHLPFTENSHSTYMSFENPLKALFSPFDTV